MMILIIGSSGQLGRTVARGLLAAGRPVRLMTRRPDSLHDFSNSDAEIVQADLRDPASLARACRGVNRVLFAAHSFMGIGKNSTKAVDEDGARAAIDAAGKVGVEQFVFTSIHGSHADHPIDVFRYKYLTECYLRSSGVPFTILRPTAFMESWAEMIARPILRYGVSIGVGRGDQPLNIVFAGDVAKIAIGVVGDSRVLGRTLDITGPENVTENQIVQMFEMIAGQPAWRLRIPRALVVGALGAVWPVAPVLARRLMACFADFNTTTPPDTEMIDTLKLFPIRRISLAEYARFRMLRQKPRPFCPAGTSGAPRNVFVTVSGKS